MDHFLIDKLGFIGIIGMASFESAGVKEGDKEDRIGPACQITRHPISRSTHCTPPMISGTSVHDLKFGLGILAPCFLFQYCEQACFPVNHRRENFTGLCCTSEVQGQYSIPKIDFRTPYRGSVSSSKYTWLWQLTQENFKNSEVS